MRRGDSQPAMAPLRLGISACLLGQAVRYDGGHKRDPFLAATLGRFVEWVAVCPEVEIGLGVPREPIRLEGDPAAPRLVAANSRRDLTRAMTRFARARAAELARLDLVGYVFKKDSPSCGLERVRVHGDGGRSRRRGTGLFARAVMARLPLLPVEEEGRLRDASLRASFVARVLAYARWKAALAAGMTGARLAAFHAAHEPQLRAHHPTACRRLGALVANAGKRPLRAVVADYGAGFMEALRTQAPPTTRRRAPRRPAPPAARRSPTARRAASRPAPRRPRSSP